MTKSHISRILRKNQTPWEQKFWAIFRDRRLRHLKFRRQSKIDRYIVDFYCPSRKLIIELDGGHHNEPENIEADLKRQSQLEAQGYTVLRFWNNEIDENIDGVVQRILEHS